MRKYFLITLSCLLLMLFHSISPVGATPKKRLTRGIFWQSLTPPHFPGGEDAFHIYLSKNIKWPDGGDDDTQGVVVISFFVEKDGTLTDFKIVKSLGKAFDAEALRVITNMPKWVPALRDKKPIKSKYSVPIKFYLSANSV